MLSIYYRYFGDNIWWFCSTGTTPGARLNIQMSSYQYNDNNDIDKTVWWPSYFIMEILHLERPSLYWDGAHIPLLLSAPPTAPVMWSPSCLSEHSEKPVNAFREIFRVGGPLYKQQLLNSGGDPTHHLDPGFYSISLIYLSKLQRVGAGEGGWCLLKILQNENIGGFWRKKSGWVENNTRNKKI